MIIELEVISQLPLQEHTTRSIVNYVPMRIFQKKLFVTENLMIEEHANSKGIITRKFTTGKYDNEFYKFNHPYRELRDKYFTPIVIKGLGK